MVYANVNTISSTIVNNFGPKAIGKIIILNKYREEHSNCRRKC
jgi:hypothetical protein